MITSRWPPSKISHVSCMCNGGGYRYGRLLRAHHLREHGAPVQLGHHGVRNVRIMCRHGAGGCPAEAAEQP